MDNNSDVNIYETEMAGLKNLLIDSVEAFKFQRGEDEYTKDKVEVFFEDLIRMVRFYKCAEKTQGLLGDENDAVYDMKHRMEYRAQAERIIDDIKSASFAQNFMEYDKDAVHKFLEDLIKIIAFDLEYEKDDIALDTNAIVGRKFARTVKGYDEIEVDHFIYKMVKEFEELNEIKSRYS